MPQVKVKKKLTPAAAKKRSVRNRAGKKAVKRAGYGKTMKAKKAKAGLKTPKASQKGLKMLPTAVRNKMGYAKKGKTVKKAGYGTKSKKAKSGGRMKKCKYGCK